MISKIGIRSNPKPRSRALANELKNALYDRGYLLTENHPDLWIAVGGDGTFLRMVRETGFDPDTMYVGIHTGTLGFLQEIHPEQLYDFLDYIDKGEYTYDIKDILVTEIHSETGVETLYSLNEILIRNAALKTMKAIVKIDGTFLEKFTGDGLMISTSVGSTAYNMCFGGAIVDNAFATMQMTPIAPLTSRSYHTLQNSFVFPDTRTIEISPAKRNILCTSDGDNTNHNGVEKVVITTKRNALKVLKFTDNDFVSKIREKFL